MARVCRSPSVKYSSIKNNASPLSWNLRDIRDIGKETRYPRWTSSIPKPKFDSVENTAAQRKVSLDTLFENEQILHQRPRLVRGWYLGKEPLEYRKRSTPFRFSFQIKDRDAAGEEGSEIKALNRKTIIYPESMTVGICTLQSRPVKREKKVFNVVTNMSTAASKGKGNKIYATQGLNKDKASTRGELLNSGKGTSALADKDIASEKDCKDTDSFSRLDIPRTTKCREKSPVKGRKLRPPGTEFLSQKQEDSVECGNEIDLDKVFQVYPKKIPDCCVEFFTFKESDYDIWSRTSKSF